MLNRMQSLVVGLLLASPAFVFGQYTLEQKSEPGGLFTTSSENYNSGTSVQTRAISTQVNDFIFTHWTINNVRQNDAKGQALHSLNFPITENTVAIAHYLNKEMDTDGDGIPDWIEIKNTRQFILHSTNRCGMEMVFPWEMKYALVSTPPSMIISARAVYPFADPAGYWLTLAVPKKLTLQSHPIGLVTSSVSLLENKRNLRDRLPQRVVKMDITFLTGR